MKTRLKPAYVSQLSPLLRGIAQLFHPHVEVVIHDLASKRIVLLENCYSGRKVGDKSELGNFDPEVDGPVIGPYEKVNWDGTKLKSVSVVYRDPNQKPIAMICLNFDVQRLTDISQALALLIAVPNKSERSKSLFKHDLASLINDFTHEFATKKGKKVSDLNRDNRAELIIELHKTGAFEEKRAADYIARALGISRATVYNYLNSTDIREAS